MYRRILVVEDEPTLRTLFRRRAERVGLHVLEAATSAQGLALAAIERPDLVVLDLHLPGGGGLRMIEQLKAGPRTTGIPIIAWSGSDAKQSESEVMRAGGGAYFEKRDVKGLVDRIVQLLHST